jgi:hypothetical protein
LYPDQVATLQGQVAVVQQGKPQTDQVGMGGHRFTKKLANPSVFASAILTNTICRVALNWICLEKLAVLSLTGHCHPTNSSPLKGWTVLCHEFVRLN